MTQTSTPASFTTHAAYAGVRCTGRTAAGAPCRALTTGTVTVDGREHGTCRAHASQVEARELDLVARCANARDIDGEDEQLALDGGVALTAADWATAKEIMLAAKLSGVLSDRLLAAMDAMTVTPLSVGWEG